MAARGHTWQNWALWAMARIATSFGWEVAPTRLALRRSTRTASRCRYCSFLKGCAKTAAKAHWEHALLCPAPSSAQASEFIYRCQRPKSCCRILLAPADSLCILQLANQIVWPVPTSCIQFLHILAEADDIMGQMSCEVHCLNSIGRLLPVCLVPSI